MTKHILIADDDEFLRLALAQLLELEGFTITSSPDGPGALRLAHQVTFDLILLDFKMPGPNGIEVLAGLRTLRPGVPVIMMSGQAGHNSVMDAIRGGACDFIDKPFDDDRVLAAVRRALELPT
jgi:DNA-binding NtrC family response regulator